MKLFRQLHHQSLVRSPMLKDVLIDAPARFKSKHYVISRPAVRKKLFSIILFLAVALRLECQTALNESWYAGISTKDGDSILIGNEELLPNNAKQKKEIPSFGAFQVYANGTVKATDLIPFKKGTKPLLHLADSLANVLVLVTFDSASKTILKSRVIRLATYSKEPSAKGLNTMALLYSGYLSKLTGVNPDAGIRGIYLDSFYQSLDFSNSSVPTKIDYYVYKKDSTSLKNFLQQLASPEPASMEDYRYAAMFAKKWLGDIKLGFALDSLSSALISPENRKIDSVYQAALRTGNSTALVQALAFLDTAMHTSQLKSDRKINLAIAISKALASEGKDINEVLKWVPSEIDTYQYWRQYLEIGKVVAKMSTKRNSQIMEWLDSLEFNLNYERKDLRFKPTNLLRFQYASDLSIISMQIAEVRSMLWFHPPFTKEDEAAQFRLLSDFPENPNIQVNYFQVLVQLYGFEHAKLLISKQLENSKQSEELKGILAGRNPNQNSKRPEHERLLVGANISNLAFKEITGKEVLLKEFAGNALVIDLWATWCMPCMHAIPSLISLKSQFADKPVRFIMLNYFEESLQNKAVAILKGKGIPEKDMLFDAGQRRFETFRITSIPCSLIIDKNGIVRDVFSGFSLENKAKFELQITEVLTSILGE